MPGDATQDRGKIPVTINRGLDWNAIHLSAAEKSIRFVEDGEGNIWGFPVMLIDPSTPGATTLVAQPNAVIRDANSGQQANVDQFTRNDLSTVYNGGGHLNTNAVVCYYNSAGTGGVPHYETGRTPNRWKSVETAVAAATTDLWTPAAGTKFRLMGGIITMSGSIAAIAKRSLKLIEETAGTVIVAVGIVIPVLGANIAIPFTIPGNGFLASTADKKLQVVTAGGTYVAGSDWVTVWGTEE